MYVHKRPSSPPKNTPFPGQNLKVGKMNYSLGNLDPNRAKCLKSGQIVSRSGQKQIIHLLDRRTGVQQRGHCSTQDPLRADIANTTMTTLYKQDVCGTLETDAADIGIQ